MNKNNHIHGVALVFVYLVGLGTGAFLYKKHSSPAPNYKTESPTQEIKQHRYFSQNLCAVCDHPLSWTELVSDGVCPYCGHMSKGGIVCCHYAVVSCNCDGVHVEDEVMPLQQDKSE